jgi:hypothetical protein
MVYNRCRSIVDVAEGTGGDIMADFVQVMNDWKRMCKAMEVAHPNNACDICLLQAWGCPAIYEDDRGIDYEVLAERIEEWAKEHPEPVYPTWEDFLEKVGLGEFVNGTARLAWLRETHIPADIAQKLGIEPENKT